MIRENDKKQRIEVTNEKGEVVAWIAYSELQGPFGPRAVADFFRGVLSR